MLDILFGSKTKIKLTRLFFFYPHRTFSVSELIKETKIGKGRIKAELADLVKIGFLHFKKDGKLKAYSLNKEFVYFKLLQELFEKEHRLLKPLNQLLISLTSELALKLVKIADAALIFGSAVAGTWYPSSDIDLLIIGKASKEIRQLIAQLEDKYKVKFETIILEKSKAKKSKLFKTATRECIWLFGKNGI